ncbi:hypothetical protein M3J09_000929 [Ascochyta lentis]
MLRFRVGRGPSAIHRPATVASVFKPRLHHKPTIGEWIPLRGGLPNPGNLENENAQAITRSSNETDSTVGGLTELRPQIFGRSGPKAQSTATVGVRQLDFESAHEHDPGTQQTSLGLGNSGSSTPREVYGYAMRLSTL